MENQLCKNCNNPYNSNYCSNCGQKTKTLKLDWHYIKDEIKYTLLHVNKGFFYTIKELYTRPGETIKDFIEGKRINHYKPILLVFVLAGINSVLVLKLDFEIVMKSYNTQNGLSEKAMQEYMAAIHWFFGHYALMEILALPIVSYVSWLSFKKWGYNYIENIIINCFASGQRLIFSIFCLLLYLIIPKEAVAKVSLFTGIITFGLTIWTYATLYKDKEGSALVFRILLFLFLLFLAGLILLIIFSILFVIYLKKAGLI